MLKNAFRHQAGHIMCPEAPFPSVDAIAPMKLLERCPDYSETPLHHQTVEGLDATFFVKDERQRMGLGSFKALGAAYVIAHLAQQRDVSKEVFITCLLYTSDAADE